MDVTYTRTITRKDGTRLAEFVAPSGNLCVKFAQGMTIEDARREAAEKMAAIEKRVAEMLP